MTPFEHYCTLIEAGQSQDIPWALREINGEKNRTLAHWAAERRLLPEGFCDWLMEDAQGVTVVELALRHDALPSGFKDWDINLERHGIKVAHLAAETGKLPPDFDQWTLQTDDAKTVAHILAEKGEIPEKLLAHPVMWTPDLDGMSSFHLLARHNALPEGFDRWDYAGKSGWTVAHEAAAGNMLDKDFPWWHLRDEDGMSVARVALMYQTLPEGFHQWGIEDADGFTVAHEAVIIPRFTIPKGFDQWGLINFDGETVAHTAVLSDRIPADFEAWDLKNRAGETVEALLKRLMQESNCPPIQSFAHYEAWRMNQAIQEDSSASSRIHKNAF